MYCTDGTTYAFTDHDLHLTVDGVMHTPAAGLKRIYARSNIDGTVSNQEMGLAKFDVPEQDLLAGKYDGAVVETRICSYVDTPLGSVVIDRGRIGSLTWTSDGVLADVHGLMGQLAKNITFTYTAGCRHQLFNAFNTNYIGACTVNKTSYTYTGTVAGVPHPTITFTCTGVNQPDGWFTNGLVTWTTGANAGLSYQVKRHTVAGAVTIDLFLEAARPIQPGDQFEVTAGCDKSAATCKTKFNNIINFGGFPHIQATS